jgi:predicted nucleotidyltransferase/DNA-binding Xre family transcriptional regulator
MLHSVHGFNRDKFLMLLKRKGFESVTDFCKQLEIPRSTLNTYLGAERSVYNSSYEAICAALDTDPCELIEHSHKKDTPSRRLEQIIDSIKHLIQNDSRDLLSGVAFILFGSRVRKTAKINADWDLGLSRGGEPLGGREYFLIRNKIEDALEDFPNPVDVVNLDQAPVEFLATLNHGTELVGGCRESYARLLGVLDGIQKFESTT